MPDIAGAVQFRVQHNLAFLGGLARFEDQQGDLFGVAAEQGEVYAVGHDCGAERERDAWAGFVGIHGKRNQNNRC